MARLAHVDMEHVVQRLGFQMERMLGEVKEAIIGVCI